MRKKRQNKNKIGGMKITLNMKTKIRKEFFKVKCNQGTNTSEKKDSRILAKKFTSRAGF